MKNKPQQGSTAIVIIVIIVAVCVGAYLFSAPLRARIQRAHEQLTRWTPENVQQDPAGYLTWAQSELRRIDDQLEARQIALSAQRSKSERDERDYRSDAQATQETLRDAKLAYTQAAASNQWPVLLRGFEFSCAQLKRDIIALYQKQNGLDQLAGASRNITALLNTKLKLIERRRGEIPSAQAQIARSLELVQLKQTVKNLGAIKDDVAALLDIGGVLGGEAIPDVETLIQSGSNNAANEKLFQSIMQP